MLKMGIYNREKIKYDAHAFWTCPLNVAGVGMGSPMVS